MIVVSLASSLFVVLFILNALIRSLRGQVKAGALSTLLAFLIPLLPISAFLWQQEDTSDEMATWIILSVSGVLLIFAVIFILIDRRRSEYKPLYSRGFLALGTSVLLALSVFYTPLVGEAIAPPITPTSILVAINEDLGDDSARSSTEEATIAASAAPTRMSASTTPTASRTPLPSPAPTRTRRSIDVPTVTATQPAATAPAPCAVFVQYNLNLRSEPSPNGEILEVIPYDSTVLASAQNEDGTWWYVRYNEVEGWVDGEFISLTSNCDNQPVRRG